MSAGDLGERVSKHLPHDGWQGLTVELTAGNPTTALGISPDGQTGINWHDGLHDIQL